MILNKDWKEGIVEEKSNIISGFKVVGLYPQTLTYMQASIPTFQYGGIEEYYQNLEWFQAREVVRMEVIAFPEAIDRQLSHWNTLDANHNLLSREQLHQLYY